MGGADIRVYNTTSAMLQYAVTRSCGTKGEEREKIGCISELFWFIFAVNHPPGKKHEALQLKVKLKTVV